MLGRSEFRASNGWMPGSFINRHHFVFIEVYGAAGDACEGTVVECFFILYYDQQKHNYFTNYQHTMRLRHIVVCGMSGSTIFSHINDTNGTTFGKKEMIKHDMRVAIFSTNMSETFLILRRIQLDITINVHRFSCKVPVILLVFMQSTRYSIGLHAKYPLFYWSSCKVPIILLVFMQSTRYSIGLHTKYPLFYWSSCKVPVILLVFMQSTRYYIGLHAKYPLFYWSSYKVPVNLLVFMQSTRYYIGLHAKYPLLSSYFNET